MGYVYSRGTATPAPAFGSTVKLVRDGRCTITTLPSGEDLHSARLGHFGDSTIVEQASDDERGGGSEDQTTKLDSSCEEKPQLSWTLTLSLLVIVTVVRFFLLSSLIPTYSFLVSCYRRRMACQIHGQTVPEHQQGMDCAHLASYDELHCR